ncbi:MAG: glycosyltransferase family 4 protein [Elusimicrobiaceae bacterium]|nr:glycosyltransferase family 4 protein [Elusimicrobiaceae bacterium]
MKIVILANDTTNLYNHRYEVVSGLVQSGYSVEIIAELQHFTQKFISLGCTLTPLTVNRHQKNPLNDLRVLYTYYKLLKVSKPDVVLTYNIKPNIYGGLACQLLGLTYLPNITGLGTAVEYPGMLQKLTVLLYKLAMRKAHSIFFQNTENRSFFEKNGIIGRKTHAVLLPGSGVNLTKHPLLPYPTRPGSTNEPHTTEEIHFLFVARILKEKGIDMYLEAAKRFSSPTVKFHICGPFDSVEYKSKVEEAVEEGIVLYHGQQQDMNPFFKQCACLLHPSWYPEGMSNVLLEAAASGRPAITTNRAGCREVVEDGKTGYIVPVQDEEAFLRAIEKFLSLSWEERKEMGFNARAKVEKEFNRQLVVDSYIKTLSKLQAISDYIPHHTERQHV